jgi:hypothetical protein
LAAVTTDPMPSTIVQKMIGDIIILIRLTNAVPSGLSSAAKSGAANPTMIPSITAAIPPGTGSACDPGGSVPEWRRR